MLMKQLISENLVKYNVNINSKNELFDYISQKLIQEGYCKDSFLKAVKNREEEFPTGLKLERTGIAIPHTYSEHILKPFIYIIKMAKSIEFVQMGTEDEKIDVNYILVLGITEPGRQVDLLMELMEKFNSKDFIEELEQAKNEHELFQVFKNN